MLKLNFFCIGAQKAATTTIHNILQEHPDVYLNENKESKYFIGQNKFCSNYEDYINKYFPNYNGEKIVGEVDPDYLFFEKAPKKIYNQFGSDNIKFLVILRNPVERAYSHYLMTYRRGIEKQSFTNAIQEGSLNQFNSYFDKLHFSYISRGFYSKHLKRYFDLFSQSKITIILFDDLIRNQSKVIRQILGFLGIENMELCGKPLQKHNVAIYPRNKKIHTLLHSPTKTQHKLIKFLLFNRSLRRIVKSYLKKGNISNNIPELNHSFKKHLYEQYYKQEIKDLEKMLQINLNHWKY